MQSPLPHRAGLKAYPATGGSTPVLQVHPDTPGIRAKEHLVPFISVSLVNNIADVVKGAIQAILAGAAHAAGPVDPLGR